MPSHQAAGSRCFVGRRKLGLNPADWSPECFYKAYSDGSKEKYVPAHRDVLDSSKGCYVQRRKLSECSDMIDAGVGGREVSLANQITCIFS